MLASLVKDHTKGAKKEGHKKSQLSTKQWGPMWKIAFVKLKKLFLFL
jgi:hypothetical protein